MYHRWTLLVSGSTYDVTGCIKNWDDIKSTISRNNYDGTEREFTSKFEFVNQAYSLIKSEHESNRLYSSATIIFSLRNNSWMYNEKFRCLLDFSSYEDDGFTISLNGVDNSMKSIIKARGGTEYEIEVSDVSAEGLINSGMLTYDGLEIEQSASWVITGESSDNSNEVFLNMGRSGTSSYIYRNTIPLYVQASEVLHYNQIEFQDLESISLNEALSEIKEKNAYFAKALENISCVVNVDFKCRTSVGSVIVQFMQVYTNERGNLVGREYIRKVIGTTEENITLKDEIIDLKEGDLLTFNVYRSTSSTTQDAIVYFKDSNIKMTWIDRRTNPIQIELIQKDKLLTKLIQLMTGMDNVTGSIDTSYDDRVGYTMLCAADSIRGIDGAKIYTSFNKFRDWMSSVFGYVYELDGYNITFRHRRAYFKDNVEKTISSFKNYKYQINNGIIYSRIKAGFDKQDYEKVNGRDEFRFGTVFSTELKLNDSELNLVSPYRADAYGIELLANKRGEDTTDNSSDKDVFMIGALFQTAIIQPGNQYIGWYELRRAKSFSPVDPSLVLQNVISPDTQFNAMFTPRRNILANLELIAASSQRNLTFASSEGNSDVIIGGVKEMDVITASDLDKKRLFTAGIISIETPETELPSNTLGLVEFKRNGKLIQGYVDEIETSHGKEKVSTYKLIEKV